MESIADGRSERCLAEKHLLGLMLADCGIIIQQITRNCWDPLSFGDVMMGYRDILLPMAAIGVRAQVNAHMIASGWSAIDMERVQKVYDAVIKETDLAWRIVKRGLLTTSGALM